MFQQGQWIFYLEALVALALLVGIVWWTASARHKRREGDKKSRDQ